MFRGSFMYLLVCAINEINKSHDSFIITFISFITYATFSILRNKLYASQHFSYSSKYLIYQIVKVI